MKVFSRRLAPLPIEIDSDVGTFFAAMDAANEPYWDSEVDMLDTLVKKLKADSIWPEFKFLWVPVGESLTGAMRALKHPNGPGFKLQNLGFEASQWQRTIGLAGDGASRIDTKVSTMELSASSLALSLGVDTRQNATAHNGVGIGVSLASLSLTPFWSNSRLYFRIAGKNTGIEAALLQNPMTADIYVASYLDGSAAVYLDGVEAQSVAQPLRSLVDSDLFLFGSSTDTHVSVHTLTHAGAAMGLTAAQQNALHSALSAADITRGSLTA